MTEHFISQLRLHYDSFDKRFKKIQSFSNAYALTSFLFFKLLFWGFPPEAKQVLPCVFMLIILKNNLNDRV